MNTVQIALDFTRSRQAAEVGMLQAEHHANKKNKDWSDKADQFLHSFIKANKQFMVEDVRYASQGIVPYPPSQRAWGGVIRRASIAGLIKIAGYQKVKNVKAHSTPAAVWKTITPGEC